MATGGGAIFRGALYLGIMGRTRDDGRMRTLAAVVAALSCSSCAWIFQSKLPDNHDPDFEPVCSDSSGWAVVDGIFAAINGATVVAAASDTELSSDDKAGYIIGGIVGTLVHIASASSGASWASSCREAHKDFAERRRRQDLRDAQQAREEALEQDERRRERREAAARVQPPKPELRGFYCASSADTGFCNRDKARCEETRASAAPDASPCAPTEKAWCFTGLCFPSPEICEDRRGKMQTDEPCVEAE